MMKSLRTNLNNSFSIEKEKRGAAQVGRHTACWADALPLSYQGTSMVGSNQSSTKGIGLDKQVDSNSTSRSGPG